MIVVMQIIFYSNGSATEDNFAPGKINRTLFYAIGWLTGYQQLLRMEPRCNVNSNFNLGRRFAMKHTDQSTV